MNLVSCPRCGAQFDVSAFAPGTEFVCGACQNLLQVPGAAAPAVAGPATDPAAPPKGVPGAGAAPPAAPGVPKAAPAAAPETPAALAKKPAVDRRRAGDAGAVPAPPEGRVERIRRQRGPEGEGGAKKRNPLPLVVAALVGLAAVVTGTLYILGGDAGKPKGPDTAGATARPGGGEKAAPEPAERTFEELDEAKKLAIVDAKRKEAARSPAAAKEVHAWMQSKGREEDARQVLVEGRRSFPTDPWLNEQLGFKDRSEDIRKAVADEEILMAVPDDDPDLRCVLDLAEKVKKDRVAGWLGKEDAGRLDGALAALKDAVAKMSDPVHQRTVQEYNNVRLNPAFTGMDFAYESFRPYVIFAEAAGPDRKERAEKVVRATGRVLTFLYARWLAFMKEDLKLDAPRVEDLGDQRVKVFIFRSRESFDAWHTRGRMPIPLFAGAYYDPGRDRFILMHLDQFDPGTIMHEGTHQLIHFYARHFCEKDDLGIAKKEGRPPEKVEYTDRRLSSAFFWFQEGIAEYFGGAVRDEEKEGEWRIGALQKGHLRFFHHMKSQKPPMTWPVEEFLFEDQGHIRIRAGIRGGGLGREELNALMYAQGWTLVHYFLHGEGGKWRERFLAFMRNELTGKSSKPYLLEAFGLPKRSDDPKVKAFLGEIEEGYARYFEALHKEMTGGKR